MIKAAQCYLEVRLSSRQCSAPIGCQKKITLVMDNKTIQPCVNIKAISTESDNTYGKRRIRKELQTMGCDSFYLSDGVPYPTY